MSTCSFLRESGGQFQCNWLRELLAQTWDDAIEIAMLPAPEKDSAME
jgi:hypothetical protein